MANPLRLLSGLGLAGGFYVSGYVVESSFQSLLGVVVLDPANRIYLESAAGFFSDFWRTLLNFLLAADVVHMVHWTGLRICFTLLIYKDYIITIAILLVTLLVLSAIGGVLKPRPFIWVKEKAMFIARTSLGLLYRSRFALVILMLSMGVLARLAWFDLPLARIQKMLSEPRKLLDGDGSVKATNFLQARERSLSKALVCAHIDLPDLRNSLCGDAEASNYRQILEKEFLASASSGIALFAIGISLLHILTQRRSKAGKATKEPDQRIAEEDEEQVESSAGVREAWLALLVLMAAVGVLQFYGKTVRSFTERRHAEILYDQPIVLQGLVLSYGSGEGIAGESLTLLDPTAKNLYFIPHRNVRYILEVATKTELLRYQRKGTNQLDARGIFVRNLTGDIIEVYDIDKRDVTNVNLTQSEQVTEANIPEVRVYCDGLINNYEGVIFAEAGDTLYLLSAGRVIELRQNLIKEIKVSDLRDPLTSWIERALVTDKKQSPAQEASL